MFRTHAIYLDNSRFENHRVVCLTSNGLSWWAYTTDFFFKPEIECPQIVLFITLSKIEQINRFAYLEVPSWWWCQLLTVVSVSPFCIPLLLWFAFEANQIKFISWPLCNNAWLQCSVHILLPLQRHWQIFASAAHASKSNSASITERKRLLFSIASVWDGAANKVQSISYCIYVPFFITT